jgi:hypothetical protein
LNAKYAAVIGLDQALDYVRSVGAKMTGSRLIDPNRAGW